MWGRLFVIAGPDRGRELMIGDGGGRLGRSSSCDLRLGDPSISREHALVEIVDGGAHLVATAATNPIRVNGRSVERRRLAPGDVVELGSTTLQYLPADGGGVELPEAAARVTVELGRTAPPPSTAALTAVVELARALARTVSRDAGATAVAQALVDALGATGAAVLARDAAGFLALVARAGEHPGTAALDRVLLARLDAGEALVLGEARRELVAPAGRAVVHVLGGGGPAWTAADLAMASALAACGQLALAALAVQAVDERRVRALGERQRDGGEPVGESPAARGLSAFIARVAVVDASVLLLGESGAGKEVVAGAIHRGSRRAVGPFVAVNCAALAESLIESELCGHEKGAFTGASERRAGRFEQADGGTLFRDEVGELSPAAQAKLLRVLEERRFERTGGTRTIAVDVRIIAATHRDLRAMVEHGSFRSDLFYRLDVLVGVVPPLRERLADLPVLCAHLLARAGERVGRRVHGLTPEALRRLAAYPWPGNIRELRNVLERALVLGQRDPIDVDDIEAALPPSALPPAPLSPPTATVAGGAVVPLDQLEREAVRAALVAFDGNKARAAAALGIDRTALYKKLRRYGDDG